MGKRILIVDDNALMVDVLTYILINNGYEVTALSNGSEVLTQIKTIHPDLVLLDAVLPGITGKEICQLIKLNKTTSMLPVIMCSGDETLADFLKQRGAPDDILQKPFDIDSLIHKIEHQLVA
ncbi:response regulator [Mucilaginibacter sp. X4EP1]|uniref:response regulator n=1 Tax=Mucilaginibacter sp. X4EP1 TaxID=2723092 RepID=UPI003AFFAED4